MDQDLMNLTSFDEHVRQVIPRLPEPMHQRALAAVVDGTTGADTEEQLLQEVSARLGLPPEQAMNLIEEAAGALVAEEPEIERWWDLRLNLQDG
ncbi:MAG: hypothetical protein ACOY94_11965 [Bacillota bacterium]